MRTRFILLATIDASPPAEEESHGGGGRRLMRRGGPGDPLGVKVSAPEAT